VEPDAGSCRSISPGLLEGKTAPGIEVIRADSAPTINGRGQGVRIRILSPAEAAGEHEVYDLSFAAGGVLASDPTARAAASI
jgi:hypothetical protein